LFASISITNYNNKNKPASTAATTATTTESESNQQSTTSSSEPLNKKLRLLENLESDHDCYSNGDGSDDDTGKTFRILQEVAAYLGPTVLTEDEKMSAVLYWKRHSEAYPHLSQIAKVYLTMSASSVPVEHCSLLLVW